MTTPLDTSRLPLTPKTSTITSKLVLQGRYEIVKKLGAGGMSTVYLARDLHFSAVERLCAVKEMLNAAPDIQTRTLNVENFTREASILAELSHPSIPKVYDFFTQNNKTFLVMEYIEGKDLEDVWSQERGPLPPKDVIPWGLELCDVMAYLHSQKPPVVFRDMKPSNIMRTINDTTKAIRIVLIDFGIAKGFQAGPKGTMIGTEGYAPPEQYRGMAEPRGDVYALGATLHHLLSGRDPRLEAPFTFGERPIRATNLAVTPELEAVIMKALDYEMDKRYASMDEFATALRAAFYNSPSVTAAIPSLSTTKITETPSLTTTDITLPPTGLDTRGLKEPQTIQPVWQFKCEDEVFSSPRIMDNLLYVGCYDHNLYAVNVRTGKFAWKYPTEGGISSTPCVTPTAIYIGSEDHVLYALSPDKGQVLWSARTKDAIRSSPRIVGNIIVVGSDDGGIYGFDIQRGSQLWRFAALQPVRSSAVAVGDAAVIGSDDGNVYAVNIRTGRLQWKYNAGRLVLSTPAYHDGLVVVGAGDMAVHAMDARTGRSIWRTRTDGRVISSPAIANGVVYIGAADGNIYALDTRNGRVLWKVQVGGQIVSSPAIANGLIYFGDQDGNIHAIETNRGLARWKYKTGGPVASSPLVHEGHIYVGSMDHCVYALPAI
jgi:outer membrane protein assembly factor BamB/tRNA A-37 threonylcarbamoyl transferase component Bud32